MKTTLLLLVLSVGLSGCAEYIQDAETIAQKGITNQQRIDDDFAKGVSIAPQAIPSGALARFPAGPAKCALATLAGLELSGCTAATTQDVQNIVQQQMSVHFGPAAPAVTVPAPSSAVAPMPSPSSSIAPATLNKILQTSRTAEEALARIVAVKMEQH